MNKRIKKFAEQAVAEYYARHANLSYQGFDVPAEVLQRFAELIVKECIDKIETHRIPVGNSAAGEMACEWTYEALKEIRDDIKQHFGVEE